MPRFFDDYSNTYLTHDSAAGRKQQRRGWKFRENFRLHYEKNLEEWRSGPMGLAAAQQAYIRSNGQYNVPPLPEGWREENDEATRALYYTHVESGKRQWVRPGFVPPAPGVIMRGPPPPPNMHHSRFTGPPPMHHPHSLPPPNAGPPPPMMPPPGHHLPPPPPPAAGSLQPPPPFPPHAIPPPNLPPPPQQQHKQ